MTLTQRSLRSAALPLHARSARASARLRTRVVAAAVPSDGKVADALRWYKAQAEKATFLAVELALAVGFLGLADGGFSGGTGHGLGWRLGGRRKAGRAQLHRAAVSPLRR